MGKFTKLVSNGYTSGTPFGTQREHKISKKIDAYPENDDDPERKLQKQSQFFTAL